MTATNLYYNAAEIYSLTENLALTYPSIARTIQLPFTTVENRTSLALHLGAPSGRVKDAVMIIAGVHGCEWGSCEIVLNLATDVLQAYTARSGLGYGRKEFGAQEIQDLLDKRDIVIFPLVNPDGRECSQTQGGRDQWRRNRNPAYAPAGAPAAIGVDLNRNYDFLFDLSTFAQGSGVSASDDPGKPDYYHGPTAFSEAETCNVRWLLDAFPSTKWFVDIHCTGQLIHYVWSHDDSQDTDPTMNFLNPTFNGDRGTRGEGYKEYLPPTDRAVMQALAERFATDVKAVAGTKYKSGPAFELTPFSGTSYDYAYSRHLTDPSKGRVLGFLVEWGKTEPQPLWVDMEPIIREVTAGLIGFCSAAN